MTQQYPQPPAQGQVPMQPMQPMQPPKKKHTALKVIGIIVLLGLIGLVGCVAVLGKAANDVGKSIDEDQQKNAPREVVVGKAFTVGKHETLAGWKVTKDTALGGFQVVGSVKNASDATSTAFVHFKFLDTKGTVLGNVQCSSGDLEPGQTQALSCAPDGTYGKYRKVDAEATF